MKPDHLFLDLVETEVEDVPTNKAPTFTMFRPPGPWDHEGTCFTGELLVFSNLGTWAQRSQKGKRSGGAVPALAPASSAAERVPPIFKYSSSSDRIR